MEKLVIFTKETIFGGVIKSILAELADSLAASVASDYEVYVVCPLESSSLGRKISLMKGLRSPSSLRFFKINYLFYHINDIDQAAKIIDDLDANILHVIGQAEIIEKIHNMPKKKIYTFSDARNFGENIDFISKYDAITCPSKEIIKEIGQDGIIFTPCGLLLELFQPSRGLLLTKSYSVSNQAGREKCRQTLVDSYNIPENKIIFLISDIRRRASFSEIIKMIPIIDSVNGFLLISTNLSEDDKNLLLEYKDYKNYKYIGDSSSPMQIPLFKSGADFCIIPNDPTMGNFTPLGAAHYGCIPILSLDNPNLNGDFTEENSIVVHDSNFDQAIIKASQLFANKEELERKRAEGMKLEKDWKKKKQAFIEVYES